MEIQNISSKDPIAHTQNIAMHLHALKDHCEEDISKVEDPSAKALFQRAAQVLGTLEKDFQEFKRGSSDDFGEDENSYEE
ncbi:hypothetical protein [Bdellovibrio sp. NC01]|uniref:hypothetical protein n=1 Tax=Bdellovibrio sp. NC01 TaxID=2220073 RepID=UPI0011581FB0|nr:hypothetical protein [Bdellovibrio sp. NC01]QDK38004.1 hypothetical protein DOE51_10595 [Bdellovibrio sp. NC01]